MHSYLRAIGFGDVIASEHEAEVLLDNLFHTYDERNAVKEETGNRAFIELSKSFGPNIGIRICGEMDEYGFHRQYYYPYLNGSGVTSEEDVSVEKHGNGNGYSVMVDDGRVGISLICFLQNPGRFRKESFRGQIRKKRVTTTLSGLSLEGTILLPVDKKQGNEENYGMEYYRKHDSLVTEAKNGSQEAIESLTMEDMDTYAMISRRILNEDVLTIVETYFMPYGLECDQYQILGTILFYTKVFNSFTQETLYQMTLECNGMTFDICINQKDLLGDPEAGRRFKGNVWLQGKLNFLE